ncbi:hypothetical protein GF402_05250 [Candidatus Fermentibacteria bacterium]|nr:hypothetical protein [Candidatus Fermentibacteria bacterium]
MGVVIWISDGGSRANELADGLKVEMTSRGGKVELLDAEALGRLGAGGNHGGTAAACDMLARHGAIVIVIGKATLHCDLHDVEVQEITSEMIASEDAIQRFLRKLELSGLLPPPKHDVHPDEEEEIRKKLSDLGYL